MIKIYFLMFLYTLSYFFIFIVEQDFFILKSCLNNLEYNKTICNDINNHEEKKEVQKNISNFIIYKNILNNILPMFIAYFLAAKFETQSRKYCLIIGLIGKILYSVIILLNSYYFKLDLYYCLLSFIPLILTGGDIIISSSIYSIIIDRNKKIHLNFKISLLQASYFASMPIGIFIGNFIFYTLLKNNENKFIYMFIMYTCILLFCLFYSLFFISNKLKKEYEIVNKSIKKSLKEILELFNLYKGYKDIKCSSIKLLFLAIIFYSFQKNEKEYFYLYTQKNFNWNGSDFSVFKNIQYILMFITMVIGLPLINKFTTMHECTIICYSTISGMIGKLIFYFSYESYYLYIGLIIGFLNPCSSCIIKILISKLCDESNVNKVLVLMNIFEILTISIGNIIYSQIYNYTINNQFSGIFLLSFISQLILFLINIPLFLKNIYI